MKRGDVYYADLRPVIGSEQGGIRPVVIVQNDIGNLHSPTIIVAAVTSRLNKAKLPTHIELAASRYLGMFSTTLNNAVRQGFGDPFGAASHD